MYGNLITSNGLIEFKEDEVEKEIILDKTIYYLNIVVANNCDLYLNNSDDFIFLPIYYTQPFEIRGMPIHKFKIKRNEMTTNYFSFSYYGFY